MARSQVVTLALLLTAAACNDPYSEPPEGSPAGSVTSNAGTASTSTPSGSGDDTSDPAMGTSDEGTTSSTSTAGSTGDPTWPDWPGDTTGLPDNDDEGTTWPAASMDGGGEPDTTGGTTEGEPTCTELECPVEELHGCTGDCDPCDTWAISWVPVPDVSVYLIRYSFAVPLPNEGDDIYGVTDGAFRVTAPPGAPSTFAWSEENGRLVVSCDRLTSGCPATYALLKVEVVGCVGDNAEQWPLSADCGGAPLGGVASMLPSFEIPTGICDSDPDPDTSSTGG